MAIITGLQLWTSYKIPWIIRRVLLILFFFIAAFFSWRDQVREVADLQNAAIAAQEPISGIYSLGSFPWSDITKENAGGIWAKVWVKNPGAQTTFDSWRISIILHGTEVFGETRVIPNAFTIIAPDGKFRFNTAETSAIVDELGHAC